MGDPVNKAGLIEVMRNERERWGTLLAAIGEGRMEQPGAAGFWSVKDVMAHVAAYERWLVDWLNAARLGQFPPPSVLDDDDIDRRNAQVYEATRALDLSAVKGGEENAYQELVLIIKGLSEADLFEPERTTWFVRPYWGEGTTLWEAIAGLTYDHWREHLPNLQAFHEKT